MEESGQLMGRAIAAAFAAGRAIMAVRAGAFAVEWKEDDSPLTQADRNAHAAIAQALAPTALPMLSEEGEEQARTGRQQWDRYWLVDPLDGTKEFIRRSEEFTVNIALLRRAADGDPVNGLAEVEGGVMYAPALDRLYFAWQGGGAYRVDAARTFEGLSAYEIAAQALKLPMPRTPDRPYTIVASRSHPDQGTRELVARAERRYGKVSTVSVGSALKIGLVAEGTADLYPRHAPTMEWDTAAGQAIAQEAGCILRDVTTGRAMRYNKQDLVNRWFTVEQEEQHAIWRTRT